ncbi:hypothetical protein ACFL2U_01665 [Patescibacteria group bacterium]
MSEKAAKVTKGPNGPEVNFARALTYYQELAEKLAQYAEEEWQDGEKILFIRTENMSQVFQMLKLEMKDYLGMLVNHGFLKAKANDPPGWYLITEVAKPQIPTKKLKRIAQRIWKQARVQHTAGKNDHVRFEHLDLIKSMIKEMGFSPYLVIQQLVAKFYFVHPNTLPMEADSYFIFPTQKEGKQFSIAQGRK